MNKTFTALLIFLVSDFSAQGQALDSINQAKFDELVTSAVKFQDDFNKAITLIDSAIALDSNCDHAFVIKSEFLWTQKRYAEAAENYKRALWLNRDTSFFFGAYLVFGVLLEKSYQLQEAKVNYLKAIKLFEAKKQLDKFYPNVDREDYAVAVCLSGNKTKWRQLLKDPSYIDLLKKYRRKSRVEVRDTYFQKYGG